MRSGRKQKRNGRLWCALACCAAICGCGRPKSGPKPPPKSENPPSVTGLAKGVELIGNDVKGRRLYSVRTLKSTQSAALADATLTDTRVTLYHEGAPDIVIEAPNARVDVKAKDLIMWGRLTARAVRTKASFQVDRMTWNAGTKAFVGTGAVQYQRKPVTMTSDRVSGKTPLTKVNLDGRVTMTVHPE